MIDPLVSLTLAITTSNRFSVNTFWKYYTNEIVEEYIRKIAKTYWGSGYLRIASELSKKTLKTINEKDVKYISYFSTEYPELLRNISKPPLALYLKGNTKLLQNLNNSVSIVGTRHPNNYGINLTKKFAEYFTKEKFILTSGLAIGIDSLVHQIAINNLNETIAVLPVSIDRIYPFKNILLSKDILNNGGLLISEYLENRNIEREYFKMRNRIIAGLSKITILIQSKLKSGSITTALHAFTNFRDVYTIAGNINDELSEGPNYLIKNNIAQFVSKPEEIYINRLKY